MWRSCNRLIVCVVVCLSLSALFGATVPGRWEKVEILEAGFPLVVKLKSGEQYKADFIELEADHLIVQEFEGEELRLAKEHVKQVQSQDKTVNDSIWEGAAIGGALGAVAGIIPAAAVGGEHGSASGAAIVGICAGIGAGAGIAVDAVIKAPEVFYKAAKD